MENGKVILMDKYKQKLIEKLNELDFTSQLITDASLEIARCIDNRGLIYIFGCGHSHMLSEEFFYRAGGLANVVPILHEPLMLHQGAAKSSHYEKQRKYAKKFIDDYQFSINDILIVASTSGKNPVPIDVALKGVEQSACVITISSFEYPKNIESLHQTGKYLNQIGKYNIDNHIEYGDSTLQTRSYWHSSLSTIIGMTIIHQLIANAIENSTIELLPIFKSGNIDGSQEHNEKLLTEYKYKIPLLTKNY